ncbi:uncharacterized protein Z518_00216 [Rhinocladiella mackenziei CBS 650.93]|uniref:Ribosomal RNA-processing protein 43 n=1 Tax=Rhinocladiella mackenziei CBS 650.93 TaxID=1442369 RepID=A0A0D2HER8_9EURO|nr:uncharacterized protein Z518_00216 [Rhinocladiella mackenziei CBS 650.93]KIX09138.1 hypothetical protein Z518_00216 [Rhinocladiella mackenziei CBS 650.93]
MPSMIPPLPAGTSVPVSAMPLISPNALLHAHVKQNPPRRPSNRAPFEPRPIQLNTGSLTHCSGSSLTKIGATTIVCGVRAEILPVSEIPSFRIRKATSSDNQGESVRRPSRHDDDEEEEEEYSAISRYHLIIPNIELSTGCSPNHPANAAPSVEGQSVSQRILSLLHSSRLVRTSDLEIIYTPPPETHHPELGIDADPQLKAYWVLYIDMICISHGGSVFDAAWLALYAALRDTILPKAWWDADLEQVLCAAELEHARRLRLRGMPVPSSFGVFVPEKRLLPDNQNGGQGDDQYWILMDTDGWEEESCRETGCVTVDVEDDSGAISILRIEKSGGSIVGADQIMEITNFAERRWRQWKDVLDNINVMRL